MKIIALDGLAGSAAAILKDLSGCTFELMDAAATREEKISKIHDADIIVVRSATKVDRALMEKAPRLKLVVRAGIGLDNVDVPEATQRGVIVMNTPMGNLVTTAEHAVSMMMSLARMIPQATASMKSGKWEKGKFVGRELRNKSLGIVGLGNIGKVVAKLAQGLGMKVLAFDPFITADQATKMEVEKVTLEDLCARADVITIHVPLMDQTKHLINAACFERMKKGTLFVHCARGGIVDEKALLQALESGKVGGAALDVFEVEPPKPDDPLVKHPKVICTPHLGASTDEAQLAVSLEAAELIADFILRGEIRNAANHPNMNQQRFKLIEPMLLLAERMGLFLGQWATAPIKEVALLYHGTAQLADGPLFTVSFLKGLLSSVCGDKVNFVNAKTLAQARGLQILESSAAEPPTHFSQLIEARISIEGQKPVALTGTLFGKLEPRFVEFDGFKIDGSPEGWVLVTINKDIPNMVGQIGSTLGANKVNIASMHLGRRPADGLACAMTNVDSEVPAAVMEKIRAIPGVQVVRQFQIKGSLT